MRRGGGGLERKAVGEGGFVRRVTEVGEEGWRGRVLERRMNR